MLLIKWTPVLERPEPRDVGDMAESERLWIEGNPVVDATGDTLLLRYTTEIQLTRLLNEVINHYGRWVTGLVITSEGKGKIVLPGGFTWFSESHITVTLGSNYLQ